MLWLFDACFGGLRGGLGFCCVVVFSRLVFIVTLMVMFGGFGYCGDLVWLMVCGFGLVDLVVF